MAFQTQGISRAVITSVTGIDDGGAASGTRLTLNGTAEAGSTVQIYDGVRMIGVTFAEPDGTWSYTPAVEFKNASGSFTAIAIDDHGNWGTSSERVDVSAGSVVLAAPTITGLFDAVGPVGLINIGATTDDPRPVMTGTGKAGDLIKLYDGGALIRSTLVGTNGTWSVKPATDLSRNWHDFYVSETDKGGTSVESKHLQFKFDDGGGMSEPHAAVITSVGGAVNGGSVSSSKPVITGTADVGSTVQIFDGVRMIGVAAVEQNGTWRFTPESDLKGAMHSFTAIAVDSQGHRAAPSDSMNVMVGSTAPAEPVITGLFDAVGPVQGPIVNGATTDDPRPTMTGTGRAGDLIKLYDGGALIGSAVVGSNGSWAVKPSADLSKNWHDFYVTETGAGGVSVASKHVQFQVDVAGDVTVPHPAVITSVGGAIDGGTVSSAKPVITGTADVGSTVQIFDGPRLLGVVPVEPNGTWKFTPEMDLKGTTHTFIAIAIDSRGHWGVPSAYVTVTIGSTVPAEPFIQGLFDTVGPVQGLISNGMTTDDPRPALTGTGKAGDLIKLYDAGTLIGSATVGANGAWSVKPAADLSKNWHDLYVTETGAGGTSAESKHIQFQFDNTVPNKPAITGLTGDNGLPITGGTTENPHPSMSGAGATPGDTITLYDGKLVIGSTQAGADGRWTVKPGKDLSVGQHDLYVIETSRAGVPGAESDHVVFSVTSNTGPLPPAPEITDLIAATGPHAGSVASGQISTDGQPTVKGTGHAGDQINVFDGAKLLGTTIVNAEGKWSFKPADELRDGAHKLHVSATHDGVTSAPSADYLVSVTYILISGVYDSNSMPIGNGGTADGALTIKGWLDRSVITHGFDLYMSGGNASVPQKMTGASITVTGDTFTIQVSKDTASSYGAWHPASGTFVFSFMADSTAGRIDTSLDKNLTYTVTDDFNASPALVKSVSAPDAVAHDHQAVVTEPTILKAASVVADATPAAPAAVVPVINAAHDTGAETYVVSGTGHAGDLIRLFDGAVYIGAGFVDNTGHWSIEPSTQLDYGTHGLTATANSAGVTSAASASFGLTVGGVEPNPQPVMFDLPAPDLHTVDLNGNAAAYFQQASVHLQGGTDGVNALHLTGDHQVLDLTSLTGMTAAAKVSGFQVMDLGGHANTLKLSLVDVLNLGDRTCSSTTTQSR